jgi:hypothetical protein
MLRLGRGPISTAASHCANDFPVALLLEDIALITLLLILLLLLLLDAYERGSVQTWCPPQ